MRILHTADWHLADRLGRIDRTADLRQAVERIAGLCEQERVDVLLVAGDLFSDLARPEALQETMAHLGDVFRPFLHGGGTIVALTGNHDNETFCRTLRETVRLVDPTPARVGDRLPAGRLHLATGPTFFRLADRRDQDVQFVCLPYPTGQRYLDEPRQRFAGPDERNRALRDACQERLAAMQARLDPRLPSVLGAHLYVQGTAVRGLFRLSEAEDIVFGEPALLSGWSYVALGHIHQPLSLPGVPHVRYSGSIERMDQGEREDDKSAVLIEIGPEGVREPPVLLPLPASPLLDVRITDPRTELPQLADRYPDAAQALARIDVTYRPGEDNLPEILAALDRLFPRWYDRAFHAVGSGGHSESAASGADGDSESPHATPSAAMLDYLGRVVPPDDPDRDDLLALARELTMEA